MAKISPSKWRLVGSGVQQAVFFFAPGTQMSMDAAPLEYIAAGLAKQGVDVILFEFSCEDATPTDAECEQTYWNVLSVVQHVGTKVIGGWSLGGRIATRIAASMPINKLACISFPFHPKGAPQQHVDMSGLLNAKSALILQGTRDAFGNREHVAGLHLPSHIRVHWLEDANHSLLPRQRSAHSQEGHFDDVIEQLATYIKKPKL